MAPNLGCRGLSQLGDLMFHQRNLHKMWCMSGAHCHDEAANHQLPIAVAFWIIRIVSAKEWSRLMQNLMRICCSTCSVILNVTATQYTCSLHGVYCPHWLVQWSHHCSHMHIPVHSPWLPGYIDVTQTILIMLTMAGLFPDLVTMSPPAEYYGKKRWDQHELVGKQVTVYTRVHVPLNMNNE